MKSLAIISHKGGAGKTCSAVMLAEECARRGARTVLVDADRQRGAGLMLGIDQPNGSVQQTRNPKLRYLCSSGIPLREVPTRASDLLGLFDVAVIDTPSLDDPLARAWLKYATHVLMVIPVEPISVRTLDGAEAALEQVARLNGAIQRVGTLPTIFDEADSTQRSLLSELASRLGDDLLQPPIPTDLGLTHRAEQKEERRTEASEITRHAYQTIAAGILSRMGVEGLAPVPFTAPPRRTVAAASSPPKSAPAAASTLRELGKQDKSDAPVPGVRGATRSLTGIIIGLAVLAVSLLAVIGFQLLKGGK